MATPYKIIEVVPLMDFKAGKGFVKIYRIRFEYNRIVDWIDVPEEEYVSGVYKQKIESIVRAHEQALK